MATGPARAFSITTTVVPVAGLTNLYVVSRMSGSCNNWGMASPGEYLIAYQEFTPPPDMPGPLRIG